MLSFLQNLKLPGRVVSNLLYFTTSVGFPEVIDLGCWLGQSWVYFLGQLDIYCLC